MSSGGSVTAWIGQLQAGQKGPVNRFYQRYWLWLVGLAPKELKGARLHAAAEIVSSP
jgi:hypothetical protein